jgi:parallel beta-helix repeat protein
MSSNLKISVSKRKLLLAFFSIALICSLASGSITYVVAQGGSTPITISSGIYPGAPSYTIYTDGTTYYAKNSYGAVSYSSTNALTTSQAVMTASTNGDTIYFKTGVYSFSSALIITGKTDITITGDKGAVLSCGGQDNILNIISSVRTQIKDISFDGNKASYTFGGNSVKQHGIFIGSSNDTVIDNVYIYDAFGAAIVAMGSGFTTWGLTIENSKFDDNGLVPNPSISTGGVYAYYMHHVNVHDNDFINSVSVNIVFAGAEEDYANIVRDFSCINNYINGTVNTSNSPVIDVLWGADFTISHNKIYNCNTDSPTASAAIRVEHALNGTITDNICDDNNMAGIHIYDDSQNIQCSNNIVTNNGFRGIMVQGSNDVTVSENTILNNAHWGMSIVDYCNNTKILYNTVHGNLDWFGTSEICFATLGTTPLFVGNDGMLFENHGSFTNTGDDAEIIHGLIDTPTCIIITSENATAPIFVGYYSANAGHFHLNLLNIDGSPAYGQSGSWIAFFDPPHL